MCEIKRTIKYKNWIITFLVLAALIISCRITGFSMTVLTKRGNRFTEFILKMFPADLAYGGKVMQPLISTIQMSVAGTLIGAGIALLTSFLSAGNVCESRALRLLIKLVVQAVRTIPVLIIALIATFAFGIGTFAGTFALALYTWAILTRIGSEDIETLSMGAFEALTVTGCGKVKAFIRTLFVDMLPGYLTNALYLLETNVRHASILGYVGAGGIGLLLNEKIAWREYEKVGTILIALFFAVIIVEGFSWLFARILEGNVKKNWLRTAGKRALWILLGVVSIWSVCSIERPDSLALGMKVVRSIMDGIVHPDWNYFFSNGKDGVTWLLLETVCIAVAGTLLGAVIAAVLSFLGSKRFMPWPVAGFFRVIVMAIRTVPVLIYGIMFLRVTGPGSFAGVLTLAVTSIGLIAKRFTVSIDRMDMSAWNAYSAMGVNVIGRIKYCLIPELFPQFASAVFYRFDVNIRGASILGLVGAGGIGAPLITYMNQYRWDAVGAILLGLFALVLVIELVSAWVRRA